MQQIEVATAAAAIIHELAIKRKSIKSTHTVEIAEISSDHTRFMSHVKNNMSLYLYIIWVIKRHIHQ